MIFNVCLINSAVAENGILFLSIFYCILFAYFLRESRERGDDF